MPAPPKQCATFGMQNVNLFLSDSLGYKRRPRQHKRKKKSTEWEVAVEKHTYDLTISKLHCGVCFRNSGWPHKYRQLFCRASPLSA
jgi:hypothetical protein